MYLFSLLAMTYTNTKDFLQKDLAREGIPAEHLGHLFEPFYRAPGQDKQSGVGLGLAIVKEIIQAHGGAVGVASEAGKGATFRFTLPMGTHLGGQPK